MFNVGGRGRAFARGSPGPERGGEGARGGARREPRGRSQSPAAQVGRGRGLRGRRGAGSPGSRRGWEGRGRHSPRRAEQGRRAEPSAPGCAGRLRSGGAAGKGDAAPWVSEARPRGRLCREESGCRSASDRIAPRLPRPSVDFSRAPGEDRGPGVAARGRPGVGGRIRRVGGRGGCPHVCHVSVCGSASKLRRGSRSGDVVHFPFAQVCVREGAGTGRVGDPFQPPPRRPATAAQKACRGGWRPTCLQQSWAGGEGRGLPVPAPVPGRWGARRSAQVSRRGPPASELSGCSCNGPGSVGGRRGSGCEPVGPSGARGGGVPRGGLGAGAGAQASRALQRRRGPARRPEGPGRAAAHGY